MLKAKPLGAYRTPSPNDPNTLLGDRFLCRRATAILAGHSGVGKSTLITQWLCYWALGRSCMGVKPSRPLRSFVLQAENDDGDVAEMRDGILRAGGFTEEEEDQIMDSVIVGEVTGEAGEVFIQNAFQTALDSGVDLVIVDPVLAFLGGSASDQEYVTKWLRNWLDPRVKASNCGVILIHHTAKPGQSDKDRRMTAEIAQYGAFGSQEWAAFPRGSWCLYPDLSGREDSADAVLFCGKRGNKLGWTEKRLNRSKTTIFWEEA